MLKGLPVSRSFTFIRLASIYWWILSFNDCIQDLIKQTPDDHADFELLTNVLNSTKEFLAKISGDDRDGGVRTVIVSNMFFYCLHWLLKKLGPRVAQAQKMSIHIHAVDGVNNATVEVNMRICMGKTVLFLSIKKILPSMNKYKPTSLQVCVSLFVVRLT